MNLQHTNPPLTNVVVTITLHLYIYTTCQCKAKRLTAMSSELDLYSVLRQTYIIVSVYVCVMYVCVNSISVCIIISN